MSPYFRKAIDGGGLFSDRILYGKGFFKNQDLNGSIIAIKNPFKPKEVMFRRVVAVEDQWV